jgi:hypothetical protein
MADGSQPTDDIEALRAILARVLAHLSQPQEQPARAPADDDELERLALRNAGCAHLCNGFAPSSGPRAALPVWHS